MNTSKRGQIAILSHEAIVLTRYKDSAGIWTIGVGVTAMAKAAINPDTFTGQITLVEAVRMFADILPKYERGVNAALAKYGLTATQHEYDALVSLCYNLGSAPVGRFCHIWRDNGKEAAASKMMEYVRAGGKRVEGLVTRRKHEVEMFMEGDYGSGRVSVYTASKAGKIDWKSGRLVDARDLLIGREIPVPTPRPDPAPELPPIAIEEPKKVEEALRDAGSRTINETDVIEKVSIWGAIVAAVKEAIGQFTDFMKDLPDWFWPVVIIGVAVFVWYRSRKIKQARVDDAISGKNLSRLDHVKKALSI